MKSPLANLDDLQPILWSESDPRRLERDLRDVAAFDPALRYASPGTRLDADFINDPEPAIDHGGWYGVLPVWPFARAVPEGLASLIGEAGLKFFMSYPAAYPMVPPTIYPISPEPEIMERTQATWHVLPIGGLCLLQSDGAWQPEASLVDLLLKASGWRIEYALMKANVIEQMAVSGIVSDPSFDHLITAASQTVVTRPALPSDEPITGHAAEPIDPVSTPRCT